jgi:hypothetical protein
MAPIKAFVLNAETTARPPEDEDSIPHLEILADYCYLRNQRIYESFSFFKRQVYFVLGAALGIYFARLINVARHVDVEGMARTFLEGTSGTLGVARASLGMFFQPDPARWNEVVNWTVGAVVGGVSQPVHGLVEFARSPFAGPRYTPSPVEPHEVQTNRRG